MKHKLLIFATFFMFAMSVSAQWTRPTVTNFVDMVDDGTTTQYLYNVGTGKFFVGHHDWGTRASVDEYADAVRMTKLGGEEDYYDLGCYPAKYRTDINQWRSVSAKDWNDMWIDGVEGNDTYIGIKMWIVTKIRDIYKLTNGNILEMYELNPEEATLGVADYAEGEEGNTRLYFYYPHMINVTKHTDEGDVNVYEDALQGNFYDEWKFVSEEEYNAYLEKIEVYLAAMSLKNAIDAAKENYPGIDLTEQENVYNNTNSTKEELKAAEANVSVAIIEYLKTQDVGPDNPADYSSFIVNATFDVIDDFHGWLRSSSYNAGFGAGGQKSTCAEVWCNSFDVYQEIENLPEGVYMLACNGYSRYNDNNTTDYNYWKAGNTSTCKLYMTSPANGTFSVPVKFISEGGSQGYGISGATNSTTAVFIDEEGNEYEDLLFTPSYMTEAVAYFHDGDGMRYHNEVLGSIADGETLRIGVTNHTTSDWNIFDDFQLYYLGNKAESYQYWGKETADKSNVNLGNSYYGQPDKDAYDNVVNALKNATTKEEVLNNIKELDAVTQNLEKSKASYQKFLEEYQAALDWLLIAETNHIEGDDVNKLADYLQVSANDETDWGFPNGHVNSFLDLENGAKAGSLNNEQIEAETQYLRELKETAVKNGMVPGSDVTDMLVNPKFDNTLEGWTYKEGAAGDHNVECYLKVVDVCQTVNDVQPGVYTLTANVFERPGDNGTYDGSEPSKVSLFLNQFQTPVQNISSDPLSDEECIEGENCYRGNFSEGWPYDYNLPGYGWVPNSVHGAYCAFKAGRYSQTCYGLVGNDRVLKVGLTSNGEECYWVIWANFKLTYLGKDEDALQSLIDDYLIKADEIFEPYGKKEKTDLESAKQAATVATEANDMYNALVELVNAYDAASTSIAKYAEAIQALDNLTYAIYDYELIASEEALKDAEALYDEYNLGVLNTQTYSNDELDEIISAIEKSISALRIPDTTGASDDNPVDMTSVIVNPSYDEDGNGWSSPRTGGGQSRPDMNERYYASFDHNQTLVGLPAGTYELKLNCFNRIPGDNAQQDLNAFEEGRKNEINAAFVYAKVGDQTYAEPFRMVSEGAREEWILDGNHTSSTSSLTGKVLYCPDSMVSAGACFEEREWNDDLGEDLPLSDELNYVVRVVFTLTEESDVTIGCMNSANNTWAIWDNWGLTYFGTDSQKQDSGDATGVESIEDNASVVATEIYNVGGARIANMQRGLNIVKMSDGSVKKVFVK